ncbi:SDR family oxidoreductase [Natronolimnobius sp. AArcel1]|uniref:SDR family oxidoreductase n=1 Tax=Natronolimnobius sp. AArcel1 TaxID=1679093 RepID=UPI0013EB42E6|nr:SDR family oxidoreductase [Natronolimnobius sp. AArcel1]NGM68510.1 SDR family oxidoreductase [Natronolimnobius sp. AArcel1]
MNPTVNLRPLEEQTIVITGASSGIGLETARMAADRGANVVLAARSEDALQDLADEITAGNASAEYVAADVSDRDDIREIVATAEDAYGGFDTWINGAAVSIYGRLEDVPIEDMREQFETNVWGLLYGSIAAAQHFKNRGESGAIINIGSIVSDRAIILQGSYSASKHAVKGFTDALRMELEEEGAPVSVTLIKPSAIDTPYPEHAKNEMDAEATLPAPVYAPETVAQTILDAAEHPEREITVGGGGKGMILLDRIAPGLLDTLMERVFYNQQRTDEEPTAEHSLESPSEDLETRGGYEGHVADSSLYTRLRQRRGLTGTALAGLAATAAYAGYRALRGRRDGPPDERERDNSSETTTRPRVLR